jgi:hypothetical protein
VSDDHSLRCHLGRDLLQPIGDILVRESVKSVTANPILIELFRNREMIGNRTVATVESRIKAGDLGEIWKSRQ